MAGSLSTNPCCVCLAVPISGGYQYDIKIERKRVQKAHKNRIYTIRRYLPCTDLNCVCALDLGAAEAKADAVRPTPATTAMA